MLGLCDYIFWIVGLLLEAFVVVRSLCRGDFFRYLFLNIYMLCVASVGCATYFCIHAFGFNSSAYFYFYYCSNGLLYVLMFFVIIQFYQQVFVEMDVSRYVRGGAALLLGATALFSYIVVRQNQDNLTTRFVIELEQNLNFVGVVLIYVLWGAVMKLRETRTRLVQLVLALGIYYSATAGLFALHNLFPGFDASWLRLAPALIGTWLPLAWAYTFAMVPEDARLATATLVAARTTS